MPGPAEREFDRAARLVAPVASALIAVVAGVLALTVIPADLRLEGTLAVGLLAAWRVGYVTAVLRGHAWPSASGRLVLWIDVAVASAIALTQRWVDAPYLVSASAGWVQTLIVVTAVSYPWLARWRTGLAAAAVLAASFGAGAAITVGPEFTAVILPAIWVFGNAAMSGLTAEFVRIGARRADQATARRERARADLEVAQARREAEREHLATLHDTAAATLLMVGLGTVHDSDRWLPEQVERDLLVLAGNAPSTGTDDVVRLTRGVIATSGVEVDFDCTETELVLPADVAAALANAAREALRNVRRHAGVGAAVVHLHRSEDLVRLTITDAGRGLPVAPDGSPISPDAASASRGIRHSIIERMERTHGTASVRQGEHRGVVVTLEWRHD